MSFLHDASLYLLYAAFALVVFLAIERFIFYFATSKALKATRQADSRSIAAIVHHAVGGSPDLVEKCYIQVQAKLHQGLWLLDTVITAAPLLGLLGTILGIFDTFTALAKSGISDPQAVSAGIGTALLATAIGIGTALACLLVYNAFLAWVERLNVRIKLKLISNSGS